MNTNTEALPEPITHDDVRAAGGIVHKDGNIFFTDIGKLNACAHAAKLCAARDAEIERLKKLNEVALKACRESILYQGIDPMLDCINQAITALEESKS